MAKQLSQSDRRLHPRRKQEKNSLETQTDTSVVYDTNVRIPGIEGEISFPICVRHFKDNRSQNQQRFDLDIFCIVQSKERLIRRSCDCGDRTRAKSKRETYGEFLVSDSTRPKGHLYPWGSGKG
jgi:hypothetical protein